jgi:hypothetical protein
MKENTIKIKFATTISNLEISGIGVVSMLGENLKPSIQK